MKLHLPTMLRKALLACFAAVSTFTFASGSAWGTEYNLLASEASWTFRTGRNTTHSYSNGVISYGGGWQQGYATYSSGEQLYTVGEDNTLTFTVSYQEAGGTGTPLSSIALVGGSKAIVLGATNYSTSTLGYGISDNITADIYSDEPWRDKGGDNWSNFTGTAGTATMAASSITRNSGSLSDDTPAYTLTGIVTKDASGNYTLDLTGQLGDGDAVVFADDLDLGTHFDINRVVLTQDGANFRLNTLTIDGAMVDIPTVTIVGNSTNDADLINTPLTHRLILNLDGENNDFLYANVQNGTFTVANDVEIQSCIITNGNSGSTYKFTGTITGSGEFKRTSGASSGKQTYEFTGDMSAYSGAMSLLDNESDINNRDTLIFNGNTSGTGVITTTNYNRVVVTGATMNNSEIDATYLEISGASSFVGDVKVSTLLTLGEDLGITLGADASLTLGDGALIDLTSATYTEDPIGNRTYSVFAEGSVGTHNLTDLTADMIKDAELGYEYSFADGAITMSLVSSELFFGDGPMTWNDETDNTPFTNEQDEAAAFSTGDFVTFNGTDVADVTLGEDVFATQVTVDAGAKVNVAGSDYKLSAQKFAVNGTLNVVSGTLAPNTFAAADLGENGSIVVKNGAYLDLTAVDANVNAADYDILNSSKITTEAGGYVKLAFNHEDNQSELKLAQNVTQAYNVEAVGALMIHGNGSSNYSYTIGSGKSLIANGTSHGSTGLFAINHGTIIIAGGSVETSHLTLGHSSPNEASNGESYWGKLSMTSGDLKVGNLTLRQNHEDEFSVTGGELEFTTSTALTRGSNVRATITIQGTGAGDTERVTLKSATSAWALDGAGLTTAPVIGNVTIEAGKDISLSNVALTGAVVKTGQGRLALQTVNTDNFASLSIAQGYVSSTGALTLAALEVAADAGFAYDLSSASSYGLITAADYTGALTLNLSNVAAGDYDLFQGATALTGDQISITGVDSRLDVTKTVTNGLVSIHVEAGGAKSLTWDTAGTSDTWAVGGDTNWDSDTTPGADTMFLDGDAVTFAGTGEEISISGDVTPASVTVTGAGYSFAGSGKIVGDGALTVENGGVLEIKSDQRYTGGTTVKAGGELILSKGGYEGAVTGDIDVYGKLTINAADAIGWGNTANNISSINVLNGGELHVGVAGWGMNQTAAGMALNLEGGSITGVSGSNMDLYYGGGDKYATITASAADGATADAPTVSTISGVTIGLRQHENVITVEENARLVVESGIIDRTGMGLGFSPGSAESITKAGAGEMVLAGSNDYTQATVVQAGTLTLADGGSLASTSVTGDGTIRKTGSGVFTVTGANAAYSKLDIQGGFIANTGGMSITSLTTAADTGFAYDLATGTGLVTSTAFDGPITLKMTSLANGTFELFQGAAELDASDVTFDISTGNRVTVTTSVENGLAKLTVEMGTNNLDNLVWNAGHADNTWAVGGETNWTSGDTAEQFLNGDSVTFAGEGETITISGAVEPAAMTVTGTNYVLEGSGSIGGSGTITLAENASLTIATSNTAFTGTTTIADGSTLTITKAKALGTYNNMNNATVLGKLSGTGTFVVNLDNASDILVVKGAAGVGSMENFEGDVVIQRGKLYVGELESESAGNDTAFNVKKVTVCDGGELWTHFAYGTAGREPGIKDFTPDIDLQSGAVLANKDGQMKYSGDIRFNVKADGSGFDSAGSVLLTQYWSKNFEYSGLLSGDGKVQLTHPSIENKATYSITGENNTFAGTYETIDYYGNTSDSKIIELRLGSQTAADKADVNLASTTAKSYLLLDSDATINGLYGVVDGENAVQAQDDNRTLTVTEGDFGGLIMDSGESKLSLTKQGAADTTLILRGANSYTGATTINGGTLELAAGATLAATAITVNTDGTLKVNDGTYSNGIAGAGTIAKVGTGSAILSGIAGDFAGTIDLQAGTLVTGSALSLANNSTLKLGADGTVLNAGALTLGASTLALDLGGTGTTDMAGSALTLTGDTALVLSNVGTLDTTQESTLTLLTNVGSLADSGATALDYFSSITGLGTDIDTSTLGLQLVDGNLQLVIPEQARYLVWGEGTGTWAAGSDFTAEDDDFTADADVKFGELTGDADTVTISGAISAGKVLIDAGEGKTYNFAVADDASGLAAAESISIDGGTAAFASGTLDMTEDTTITVNDGATLSLANGAIADASKVAVALNDGGTLSFADNHAEKFESRLIVADGSTVNLVNNNVDVGMQLTNVVQGDGETATFNLSGGNFTLATSHDLKGTINVASGRTVNLKGPDQANAQYDQNFEGSGGIYINDHDGVYMSGTNTYSGNTNLGNSCALHIMTAAALSANTTLTGGGNVVLRDTMTLAGDHTLTGMTNIGWTDTTDKTVTLTGSVAGAAKVYAGNTLDLATTGAVNDAAGIENQGILLLHQGIATAVSGAGTVKIDGDITWNNSNKTYTGETQVLAGSTLTAAAPLTGGAGKVQLLEDGAMIITNSTDWANKVYGAGTLVLVNTVDNLDAIVDGTATDTLTTAYVGMPTQTFATTDVDGTLTIDSAEDAASAAKITNLVVNAGSRINVSTTDSALKVGENLTLSGAGDTAATAGTAEAAALAITAASGETKISSNITLAADTTIYAGGTGDHRLNGSFNGAGYTLTKTGSGFLGLGEFASGSTNDLSGDLVIQGGTVELVGMGTAEARQAVGHTTLAAGTTLRFFSGQYSFAEGMSIGGDTTINVGAGPASAYVGGNVTGNGTVTLNGGPGVVTLAAANDFAGTWKLVTDNRTLELGHADAAKAAVLLTDGGGKIKLVGDSTTYNVEALASTGTAGEIMTDGDTCTIAINNTTGTEATFGAYVHGEVDVQLLGGAQKFTGTLDDGSDYAVSAGTLSIASTDQSGTHSYTTTGGVLDMTGYTRAADATGADTIYALGGQVNGLNLATGMTLADGSAEASGPVTLGGATVLGAGTMNFRVTDSANMIPGTSDPYKLTDTLYQVGSETGDAITLAGSGTKTMLNISLNAPVEILDPTETNAGDGYRDHLLISGLTGVAAGALAGDFFATNLDGVDTGSTAYSLHFVQNAADNTLYDLVLRAVGSADTLFWSAADGGIWEAADQTPDSWVKAQTVDGVLTPGTTTADFEQLDYVVFGDLTDAAGAAVADVTISVAADGVQIGNMTVQGDTTNYTIGGGAIGSTVGNTGATLTKTGAATLTLTGANSYGGNTIITGGTVVAQHEAALSNTTVQIYGAGTWLVLDYAASGDGILDATVKLDGSGSNPGGSLRALQDARANAIISGFSAQKQIEIAQGKTLTLDLAYANNDKIGGDFTINNAAGMTGKLVLNLESGNTYARGGHTYLYAGEYAVNAAAGTILNNKELYVAEGATFRVQGGMEVVVDYLEGPSGKGYGKLVLEDASTFTYAASSDARATKTLGNAFESEGATLKIGGTRAATTTLTLKQGGLTIKGTDNDAAADTTLTGGTWVLNTGAVIWDSAATGALAVGANTTVKVNDDTLKNVKVNAANAVLATAKADGSDAALSVDTITVGNRGKVQDVNLTITGTGSKIQGAVAGVTVNQAGTVDLTGTPALTFASGSAGDALRATLDSLDILSGRVQVPALANPVIVKSGVVTINGANALLDLSAANKLTKEDGTTAADITINAGGIQGAQTYNGLITVDDKETVLTDGITLKNLSNAATVKLDALTANDTAMTTLKGMQGMTLADGATITLSSLLEDGQGNLLFDFADNPTGTLKLADDAKLTIDLNAVLGDVLDAATGSVAYTLADADATGLAAGAVFDAALKLYNLTAEFTTDGKLVLSQTETPLDGDSIYRSSEDNVDGTQWAGNGPDVYSSADSYASVYIDKDTVIDLTDATPTADQAENGLVLSNLIGRGNGANLTIEGDGDDLVTINSNLEPGEVMNNLKAISFNGDITVTGTELQILNTEATPGADGAGALDPESVYQINGALSTDEDSMVTITSGILKLNGKGANASELLGGVTVENAMGQLQVSGEAALGGTLQVNDTQGISDMTGDLELLSGGKVTLLDGTVAEGGFDILGSGDGKSTLSVAKDATATLSQATYVEDVVLDLQEGATLVVNVDEHTNHYGNAVSLDGLTGTGALQGAPSDPGYWPQVHITPQQDCSFGGDLSDYEGFIHVNSGKGTQTFDKVTTAADSKVELELAGKSVINVAEENGNKTLNLLSLMLLDGSDTTVEMNTDSGAPAFRINRSSAIMKDGAALTLSSAVGEVLSADADLLLMEGAGNADLDELNGKSITLDVTDDAFRRLNETAKLVVKNGNVYVDLAASETNRYEDAASDPNAKAGATLLWGVDPSQLDADSALKAVDQAVADLLQAGNSEEAERVLAATAGASTAVLGSAFSGDVERQLRAIRNRTTTMGVNQCEVNEGMPYVNAWINAEGDHREMDADGLAAGYTLDSWGGTVGFDVDITNHLTMGLAVTAMYGDLEADSADRAEGDFDTQYVSLFARVAHQAWTHTFVATIGRADVTLNRTVSYPGGSYETSGDTDGLAYGFMYEVARTFSLSEDGTTCWQPVFNVTWRHSSIDAYTESGADAALAVGEQDMNVLTFGAGARLQTVMGESIYNRASIFEARAMVKVDAGDRESEASVALLEGTDSAAVKSAEVGAVGVEIGAGVTIPVGLNAGSIFIDGSAEFRSGYTNVNGTVGYRINF